MGPADHSFSGDNFVFLGSARCFHTEDWYQCAKRDLRDPAVAHSFERLIFISDQFDGEGQSTFLKDDDEIFSLIRIDSLLHRVESTLASRWRNLLKFILIPLQILRLRRVIKNLGGRSVVHAHSTYYAFLASFLPISYISTPQGSEVLVRLKRPLYRVFAKRAHNKAALVTVDSDAMRDELVKCLSVEATVIQNGISIQALMEKGDRTEKTLILSMRGWTQNYRIRDIFLAQDQIVESSITSCFPFSDAEYEVQVRKMIDDDDIVFGRLGREDFHNLLSRVKIAISIPISDSSPRSVYEVIFSGGVVLVSANRYVEALPNSMRSRLVVVDPGENNWLGKGVLMAETLLSEKFVPCEQALELFDQRRSMRKVIKLAENIVLGAE